MKAEKFGPRFAVPSYIVSVRGEHGSMVTSDPAQIAGQAECYLSSRPGGVVDVDYFEQCGRCKGAGTLAKRGRVRFARKPCPTCKGQPELVPAMRIKSFVGPAWAP